MTRITAVFALLAAVSVAFAAPASTPASDDALAEYAIYQRIKEQVDQHGDVKNLHVSPKRAPPSLQGRAPAITQLTTTNIASLTPYSYYASAGYCKPNTTLAWNCGLNCAKNPGFKPIASGGDGTFVQFWYVGYDPALNTIVVGHQGTDFSKIVPGLVDASTLPVPLNKDLFPGLPFGILVHQGFSVAHALTASKILTAVKTGLGKYPTASVTTVGHSLGGALALLDGVFLPLHLPASTTFKTFTYGQPRVGNSVFADYVDSAASRLTLTRVTNKEDPVPILPPRLVLGFKHTSGEVHIDDPTLNWYNCPGQDNSNQLCSVGDATSLLDINGDDHLGPYGEVTITCTA